MPRLQRGVHFHGYVLGRLLGVGQWAEVYEAYDLEKRTPCALKVLKEDVPLDAQPQLRLTQEAEATAQIDHVNVARWLDGGIDEGVGVYLVHELIDAPSLDDVVREAKGTLEPRRALDLVRQACEGLAAAHAKGVIHRDLSPDNILVVRPNDLVKVVDFGDAWVIGGMAKTSPLNRVGSADWSAPEYLLPGRLVSPKMDVYAISLVLYRVLAGYNPIVPKPMSLPEVYANQIKFMPLPLAGKVKDVSPYLSEVVLWGLAKHPDQRPDMATLAYALAHELDCMNSKRRAKARSFPFANRPTSTAPTEKEMPVWRPTPPPSTPSSDQRGAPAVSGVVSRDVPPGNDSERLPASGTSPASPVRTERDAFPPPTPPTPDTLRTPSQPAITTSRGTTVMPVASPPSVVAPTARSPRVPSNGGTTPMPAVGATAAPQPLAATLPLGERVPAVGQPLAATLPLGETLPVPGERRSSGIPVESNVTRSPTGSRAPRIVAVAAAIVAVVLAIGWYALRWNFSDTEPKGGPALAAEPTGATLPHPAVGGTTIAPTASASAPPAPQGRRPARAASQGAPK